MARGAAHYATVTRRDLSPRQREVLELIAAGKTNGEIAERLGITLDGAKWHVSEILGKLGVGTREEAAAWWAAERGLGARLGSLMRGFAPWASWKVAVPVAGVVAVGGLLLALMTFDSSEDDAFPVCTPDDVVVEPVQSSTAPPGEVLVVVTGRARERPCAFKGSVFTWVAVAGNRPIDVNSSNPSVDMLLGVERTSLAHILWTRACLPPEEPVYASGSLLLNNPNRAEGEIPWHFVEYGPLFLLNRPPCPEGASAGDVRWEDIEAAASSFLPEIGPDPLIDAVWCYPTDQKSKWQKPCEVADRIQLPGLNTGDLDAIFQSVELTQYTCPEPAKAENEGKALLCEGAYTGELRRGIPVTFGAFMEAASPAQLRARLETMIESAKDGPLFSTRIATAACFDDACSEFAVGIANDGSPAAAYLVYRVDGGVPKLIRAGFAGDVALEIRRGGTVRVGGPMDFVPIIPPY